MLRCIKWCKWWLHQWQSKEKKHLLYSLILVEFKPEAMHPLSKSSLLKLSSISFIFFWLKTIVNFYCYSSSQIFLVKKKIWLFMTFQSPPIQDLLGWWLICARGRNETRFNCCGILNNLSFTLKIRHFLLCLLCSG